VRPRMPAIYTQGYKGLPVCHYKKLWAKSYTTRKCLAVRKEFEKGQETLFVTRLRVGGKSATRRVRKGR